MLPAQAGRNEGLKGDDRKEAQKREEEEGSGSPASKRSRPRSVKVVYDLSATPFFLRGSGYSKARFLGRPISR
ncbi:MAG: hypothetical protein R2849_00900 [Thermomicrobiales bacterium]